MVIKIGVNGFGRIGRIVSRTCLGNHRLQLTAINDPALSVEYVCYLLQFDSTHGKLNKEVTHSDHEIVVDGQHINFSREKYPDSVPWSSAAVDYVIEASGMCTTRDKASGHLSSACVKRVIVTAPSVDIPMMILGVNDNSIAPDCRVISCASSTLYCLAPIIKVLESEFGVEDGFVTSIHAMTPSLKPLDGLCLKGKHWRDHRSIHQNIIPAATGACKALGRIMPALGDKLCGLAFRVPVVDVSVLDLTIRLKTNTSLSDIVEAVHKASKSTLKNIIKVSKEQAVSSDFISDTHSCILDEISSLQLKPNYFKIICWYENEYSYACRVVDTIIFSENNNYNLQSTMTLNARPFMTSKMLQTDVKMCKSTGYRSELISTISQDTGIGTRASGQSVMERKRNLSTVSAFTSIQTKTDDLLTKWNNKNEIQINLKPNKCHLFQPCVKIPYLQFQNKELDNTQERLKNVKREFTRMVNLTTNLLSKTKNNVKDKSNLTVENDTEHQSEKEICVEIIPKSKVNGIKISCREQLNCNCSGDSVRNISNKYPNNTKPSTEQNKISRININVITKDSRNSYDIKNKHKISLSDDRNDIIPLDSKKSNENICITGQSKYDDETLNISRFIQNKPLTCVWNSHCTTKCSTSQREIDNVKSILSNFEYKDESLPHRSDVSIETISTENIDNKSRLKVPNCGTELNQSETHDTAKKDNILTAVNSSDLFVDKYESVTNLNIFDIDTTHGESETVTISEETLKSVTDMNNVNTSVYNDTKQELYDKLDSASGSESSSSLDVNERKSHVIHINDIITNSVEDLNRLNNICRIIEISDELSDKLFSALSDTDVDVKKNRWSFKDLCNKLKLDEFCNKVFGGSTLNIDNILN